MISVCFYSLFSKAFDQPPNYNLYPFFLNFNTLHVICVLVNPLSFVSLFVLVVHVGLIHGFACLLYFNVKSFFPLCFMSRFNRFYVKSSCFYMYVLSMLFVLLSFFFWPLCCLFFFDIRFLITPLVSSISFYTDSSITSLEKKS